MDRFSGWRWPIFLATPLFAFAPAFPELARSHHGAGNAALWLAVAFPLLAIPAMLAGSASLMCRLASTRSQARRLAALMVVPSGSAALLLLPYLPTALVLLVFESTGSVPAPHFALLVTKYLHFMSWAAWEFHTWIIFPVVLAGLFGLLAARRAPAA